MKLTRQRCLVGMYQLVTDLDLNEGAALRATSSIATRLAAEGVPNPFPESDKAVAVLFECLTALLSTCVDAVWVR